MFRGQFLKLISKQQQTELPKDKSDDSINYVKTVSNLEIVKLVSYIEKETNISMKNKENLEKLKNIAININLPRVKILYNFRNNILIEKSLNVIDLLSKDKMIQRSKTIINFRKFNYKNINKFYEAIHFDSLKRKSRSIKFQKFWRSSEFDKYNQ